MVTAGPKALPPDSITSGYKVPCARNLASPLSLAAVSKDAVMAKLLSFLKSYIKELDLQVLFITHNADKISQISDINYLVDKENGIANIRSVSNEEILEMQSFDVNDNISEIP